MNKEIKTIALDIFKEGQGHLFRDGEVSTTFFVKEKNGKLNIIMTPWNNDQEKYTMLSMIQQYTRDCDAEWVMFLGEVWTATVDPTHPESRNIERVSDMTNKEEVLMMVIMEPNGETNIISTKIKRATLGHPYTEGKIEWSFDDNNKNIQMNMIQPWR